MVSRPHNLNFNTRSSLLTAFLLLLFCVIIWRLFDLQILQGRQIRQQAEAQHSIYKKLLPSRGDIDLADKTTLQTIPLATNIKSYTVYAVPQDILNPELTAYSLASVLGLDAKDILSKITDKTRRYVPLKKQLTDDEQAKIKALNLSGIYFDSEDTRVYPQGNLLSQVVGFVGYDATGTQKVGLYGLERSFQTELAGKIGSLDAQKDALGAVIEGPSTEEQPAQDGVNLVLTIDKTLQFQAQSVLQDTVTKNGADSGCVIIADPKTGAILAMATYPDFDPNNYGKATNPSVFNNEATSGVYEPGSTFKAITMASTLDENKVTPQSTYTDYGFVNVDNYTVKNAEPGARGVQTMMQVIDFSLNTGAIFAENQLGNPDFLKYLKTFGFGQKTGIELPEAAGDLSGLKGNVQVNYDTASFGQGISVTPIQMVQAYIALANNGTMLKPYIVQTKINLDGSTQNTKPWVLGQVVTPQTAQQISAMLVDDVENGFGKKAAVPGYFMAGKTGTAQVPRADGKPGYDPTNNIGSFIGYGPIENPRFVMLVRVDHPRDVQFAESTAAPAWGQLAQFILNYMHIAPTRQVGTAK